MESFSNFHIWKLKLSKKNDRKDTMLQSTGSYNRYLIFILTPIIINNKIQFVVLRSTGIVVMIMTTL